MKMNGMKLLNLSMKNMWKIRRKKRKLLRRKEKP
jgi:hypothetical protein